MSSVRVPSVVKVIEVEMRLVMMGTGLFATPTFEAILRGPHTVVGLVTQPDRQAGREKSSTRQVGKSMKDLAVEANLPVFQPESINTAEGVEQLLAWKPDLLVVAAYGQILSRDVLMTAPQGGINVHASLLPKYRGAAPIAWAIYHGEKESGVTIIRMSVALDAGDMLAQEAIAIGPDETAGELETRLGPLGARLAVEIVEKLAQGPVAGLPQDKSQVTKAPKLTKEHGLIDWTRPAQKVCDQIRAMQPWPTAYAFLLRPKEEPVRLLVSKAVAVPPPLATIAPPGAVHVDAKHWWVHTGDGWVEILEVQPAGKKKMPAADFLRGFSIPPGSEMGAGPTV